MIENILTIVCPTIFMTKDFMNTGIDYYCSLDLELKIPKEPQLLYFGTENFEQFRFQSIQVLRPKLLGSA